MNRLHRWVVLGLALLAGGCASVTGGNTQKMYVQARSQEGAAIESADCTLSNDKGSWRIKSPGDTTIVRSNKAMEVRCEKAPLPQGIVSVESGVRAAMFGNILIGGVIGAVVDHASGAAYEYPEMIRVVMGRTTSFTLPRGGTPQGSGFAGLQDVDAVPHLGPRGRDAYREWLGRPQPRAFAVAPNGYFFPAYGMRPNDATLPTDTTQRALVGCERSARMPCKLYAVNDQVVWEPEPAPASAAARPAAAPMTVAATAPAPGGTGMPGSRPQPGFIASGYASVEDIDALPYLSDRGRAAYQEWLTRPTPKAFAISTNGHWSASWSLVPLDKTLPPDPTARALVACERSAGIPCRMYAINGSVVWKKEP